LGSALVFLAFFKPSFPSVLLVAVLFAFFNSPLIPLMDALVLEWLGDSRERYGPLRAWGSWGFVAMMLVFGLTLKREGSAQGLLPALVSFVLLRWLLFVVAWRLPPNGGHRLSGDGDWRALKSLFADRQWQAFLGISLLSTISNGAFYAFFPLYLNRAGIGDNWQGYFWVIAVLAEIAFMAKFASPLIQRLGLKGVMLLGIAGRMVRYGAYAFPLPFPVLLMLQLLHALTFGAAHTASVTWVSLFAPPSARALMQTLYASILMGIGNAIGAQLGGWVSEHWGLRMMFGLAGMLNAIAFVLGWCWLREPVDGKVVVPISTQRGEV
jgi:PPP family 3-phenylpropionic acid transporter